MRSPEARDSIPQPDPTASSGALAPPPTEPRDLALIDQARAALAEARTIEEAKDIGDRAAAVAYYAARKQGSEEAERHATEIRLRAERKIGELAAQIEKAPGKRTDRPGAPEARGSTKAAALEAAGIAKEEASRFERIAAIPEKRFEEEVQRPEASTRSLARIGGEYRPKRARPRRRAEDVPAGPQVSDRILDERARRFLARVEELSRPYIRRWPVGTSVTPLAEALRHVAAEIDQVEMERRAGAT